MEDQSGEGHTAPLNTAIQFAEISHNHKFTGFGQEIQFDPHPHPFLDLSHFLRTMAEKLRPMVLDTLSAKTGVIYMGAKDLIFCHPNNDLQDMDPQYNKAGKRTLMHKKDV